MLKINASELGKMIYRHYEMKVPLMIFGPPGCAKSAVAYQTAQSIAKAKGKEFYSWSDLTMEKKKELIQNPKGSFVFCDQRISQMDSTDLRGIPNMLEKDMLDVLPMSWVIYFTRPDADGFIFFDEIKLAAPVVAGSAYQIIHDRSISDRRLGNDVFLLAAGNRATDKAYVHDMPFPLKDRFDEVEVYPDVKTWTDWASKEKVNSHVIMFLNWKESNLFRPNDKGIDKGATPRGWARGSKMIGEYEIDSNDAQMMLAVSVGEAAATEFKAYVKHFQSLNWKKIYEDPASIKDFESDKLFAIAGGISEQYSKIAGEEKQYAVFEKMVEIITNMPEEFSIITLRMMQRGNENGFRKNIKNCKSFQKTCSGLAKFIL